MNPGDNLSVGLEERLRFETPITDLSSRFVNLPREEVDGELMGAERMIREFLDLGFSALWPWSDGLPRSSRSAIPTSRRKVCSL
jgi:hypothetical protein